SPDGLGGRGGPPCQRRRPVHLGRRDQPRGRADPHRQRDPAERRRGVTDFDGCGRKCRLAQKHTLTWGECERAPVPEATVSLSKIFRDGDGYPSIGYDSYTVQELADLIEPALRKVQIRLGPNALAMLQRGETVGLSGGEYADLSY